MIPADREYARILDVGQGTGWMTHKIKRRHPHAQVVGMDLAPGMVQLAREKYEELSIVQARAEQLPFKTNSFDLVTSNLVYQWLDNLDEAFKLIHSVLKEQGVICLAVFGQQTLSELFDSLIQSCHEDRRAQMAQRVTDLQRLPNRETVRAALVSAGFCQIEFNEFILKMNFENMFSVLKWVKAIGANALEQNFYLGRDQLFKADEYYRKQYSHHGGVCASFEVFVVRAQSEERLRSLQQ